jgi:hypothetical protein
VPKVVLDRPPKPEWLFKGSLDEVASQWMLQFSVVLVPKKVVPGLIYQSRNGYSNHCFKMKIAVRCQFHVFSFHSIQFQGFVDVSKPEWLFKLIVLDEVAKPVDAPV